MVNGDAIAEALIDAGVSHVVWIPDSHLGLWDASLGQSSIPLIRPTREGEAVAIAAGLMLGGATPLVMIQCTGLFEAGDAIRNVVHDLGLPLKMLVGVRSWQARATTADNCPTFTEPFVKAWNLPFTWFDPVTSTDPRPAIRQLMQSPRAEVLLWGE
jgi:sulfopyruvate decarboxylase TPP-binding subunit